MIMACILCVAAASSAMAQTPPLYKQVSRLTWVVRDARPVVAGWTKLGLTDIAEHGETTLGPDASIRAVSGRLGDVWIDFIQPAKGKTPFHEFLARRGDGVFALMYQAPSEEALNQEVERLRGLGAAVLFRGVQPTDSGEVTYAYFDTEPQGKYVLGLIHSPGSSAGARKITQFAFVVRDTRPVSAFWKKLGFPEISTTRPQLRDLQYRGKAVRYDQELGWQRHGAVPFEWCVPPKGAGGVYDEFLNEHGEGLQHVAFQVADMDQAIAEWRTLGFGVAQSGAWGELGQPGSGRFAYMDTASIGGVLVELLWNESRR